MPTNMIQKLGSLLNQPGGIPQLTNDNGIPIYSKDADALILGSATKEGGDIKVYRDASGNLQLSVDADAASNGKALDVYGGVVCQNYLTVGQAALNTSYVGYINGSFGVTGIVNIGSNIESGGYIKTTNGIVNNTSNQATIPIDIIVSGTDAIDHGIKLQIDSNDIIVAQATGDGAGGITNKAIGLYGTTPATQAAAISNPAESTAGNNAAIDSILAALRAIGLIAT